MKEGWKMVKLTDISENLDYMRVPITKKVREVGKYPYYGASGIVDYVNDYIYDEDLLLISEDGANLLARTTPIAFSVSGKIWVNNHAHVLRFKSLTTQKFVEYFIAGFNIKAYVTGMAQPKLNQRALEKIKLPLPPLEEQHRIVSILDASFEKIDALKKNAEENLKNAKALFQQVLTQELQPKEGWVEKKLGEVADFVRGPFGGSLTKSIFKESGYAVYEQQHAIHHHVNIRYFIDENKFDEMKRFEVKPGDLIMSCSGTIGEVYIIPLDAPVGVINQALLKLSVSSQLDRCYFKSWLESPIFKEIILKYSKGAAIPNVPGVKILKDINIVLPPLEEQHRIVRTLDTLSEKCRRLEEVAQQTIRECDALKQSILRQAFSGEL